MRAKINFRDDRVQIEYEIDSFYVRNYQLNKDYGSIEKKVREILATNPENFILCTGKELVKRQIVKDDQMPKSVWTSFFRWIKGEPKC